MNEKTDNSIIKKEGELSLPEKSWSKELKLVKEMTAKNCNETEFKLLLYMARQYGLDPLKKQIWAIKYDLSASASIFAGHAGFIQIAHESGKLDCIETTIELEPLNDKITYVGSPRKPISATTKVWLKGSERPYTATVYFDEFNKGKAVWKSHPKVMLGKCSEVACLRKAFSISNLYSPDEMPEAMQVNQKEEPKNIISADPKKPTFATLQMDVKQEVKK